MKREVRQKYRYREGERTEHVTETLAVLYIDSCHVTCSSLAARKQTEPRLCSGLLNTTYSLANLTHKGHSTASDIPGRPNDLQPGASWPLLAATRSLDGGGKTELEVTMPGGLIL